MSDIVIEPIGRVHSDIKQRRDTPVFGAPAAIEIFSAYANGLRHLEKHSHLWVIAWLHDAARDKLLVTPRGVQDQGDAGLHGVFAVRSPTRPNPVGLTVAKIDAIEGNWIRVDRLDFIDATPVIDLKPYFRRFEAIAAAHSEPIGRPSSREAALQALLIEAENFHGERCGGMALASRIVEHARSTIFDYRDPPRLVVAAPGRRGCLIDGLIALLGASFGRGTLQLQDEDRVVLRHGQQHYTYTLTAPPPSQFETVIAAPETELFHASRDERRRL